MLKTLYFVTEFPKVYLKLLYKSDYCILPSSMATEELQLLRVQPPNPPASESEDGDGEEERPPVAVVNMGSLTTHESAACYDCNYCRHVITAKPSETEWTEHWAYVMHSTQKLALDIERLEDEMNKLTARKRMFQKLFMTYFSKTPPR